VNKIERLYRQNDEFTSKIQRIRKVKMSLQTEDLGKITEKAVCILLNTTFNGKYIYTEEAAQIIADRIGRDPFICDRYNGCIHSGAKDPITGAMNPAHDFIDISNPNKQLSVKSIKTGGWKISPAKIGQPSTKKFQEAFQDIGLVIAEDIDKHIQIKQFIQQNLELMLAKYFENTFHCPILFYHQKKNICMHIERKIDKPILWSTYNFTFSHIKRGKEWNESTTVYINNGTVTKALGEFQIHNHRDCIKFRFDLQNILNVFEESFIVTRI